MAMGWGPSCSNTWDAHALARAANVRSLAVMPHTTEELKRLSDAVWERTRRRLEGLTDEEYRWEPAPGCWSIRTRRDGTSFHGWAPVVHPDPFATLAWRLWHLIDMYGEDRAPRWLDVPPQGEAVGLDAPDPTPPATAADALDQLDRAHARWDAHLALVDAGAGELDLLRKLVDLGADLGARDDDFNSTPLTWARFMRREHVVAWLEGQNAPE